MKKELFDELLESVRQGGEILRGERPPSRSFHYEDLDIRSLREKHGLSQSRFAAVMGISVGTLRNWEQGRRKPEGSARVLLKVVERHPEAVFDVVASTAEEKHA
ncbi:MAG TPA: NadS family protein [Thermoanaerobaculia bacterium]|nr:NadS family protein [Thermoanaerobaculia bacterium]